MIFHCQQQEKQLRDLPTPVQLTFCSFCCPSLLFPSPSSPAAVDWSAHYPQLLASGSSSDSSSLPQRVPTIADVGCGFGGLLS
jgi:hypothetical protein